MSQLGRKKLLLISTRVFWPPDSGRKIVLYNYCRELADSLGYEVYVYTFREYGQTESYENIPSFISGVYYAEVVKPITKIKNLFTSFFGKQIPLQSFGFLSKKNASAIQALLDEISPDVLMFDMIRTAPFLDLINFQGKIVLDLDDLLSKRYERQRAFDSRSGGSAFGKLSETSSLISRFSKSRILTNYVLWLESKRVKSAELHYGLQSDLVVFVSPKEADEYNKAIPLKHAIAAPIGIDTAYYLDFQRPETVPGLLSFVGDMSTAANQDSLAMIIEEILPQLPDCQLRVIGSGPEDFFAKYETSPDVDFLGRVDDLRTAVAQSEVYLAPIAYGTGVKTKILEAMALGVPVVTNSIGVEGLAVKNGIQCFFSDDSLEQANDVRKLLQDATLRKNISQSAKEYIRDFHSWDVCKNAFQQAGL